MNEQTTPMPDTNPPTEPAPDPEEQPEGDRYDGGEIPPAEEPVDPEPDE
jgi:hypothetical protein